MIASELKAMVEKALGVNVTQTEIDVYIPQAQAKRDWIISREGDAEGVRNTPGYLAMLVADLIKSDWLSDLCADVCRLVSDTKERACSI